MDDHPSQPSDEPVPNEPAETTAAPPSPPAEPVTGWVQPPPDRKSGRTLPRLLAAIAVVLFGLVGIFVLLTFLGSQIREADPYETVTAEFGQRLIELPEFKARYSDVDTAEEAYQVGQQLGAVALARIADADLLRYWQLSERLLGVADDAACAGVMRQTIGAADAAELMRKLELEEVREMLDITYRAFEAELKETPGPAAPSDADVQAASFALAGAMGADTVVEMGTTLSDITASDAEVCAAARSFVQGVLALEEPHRTTMLRYMVTSQGG